MGDQLFSHGREVISLEGHLREIHVRDVETEPRLIRFPFGACCLPCRCGKTSNEKHGGSGECRCQGWIASAPASQFFCARDWPGTDGLIVEELRQFLRKLVSGFITPARFLLKT